MNFTLLVKKKKKESIQGGGKVTTTERREGDIVMVRPFGVAVMDSVLTTAKRRERGSKGDLIKCPGSFLVPLMDSQVAITDEALLVEANQQPSSMLSYSSPSTPDLKLWVQDGSLELSVKIRKGTSVSKAKSEGWILLGARVWDV